VALKSLYTGSVCSQAGPPTVIRTAPAAASSVEVPPQEYTLLIYRKFCVPQNGHLTGLRSAAIRLGCHEEGAFLWAGLTPRDRKLIFPEEEPVKRKTVEVVVSCLRQRGALRNDSA